MIGSLKAWVLAGALTASIGLNVQLMSRGPLQSANPGSCCGASDAAEAAAATSPALTMDEVLQPTRFQKVSVTSLADIEQLHLTTDQRSLIESLCGCCVETSCPYEERLEAKTVALEEGLRCAVINPDNVRVLARELGELRAEGVSRNVETILAVRSVLSKEQMGTLQECCKGSCAEK